MNKAPEREITDRLNSNAALVSSVGAFHLNQFPRGAAKMPLVIVQLVSDAVTKHTLSKYGGEALMQFDMYNKRDTPELRETLKTALREIRGTVGGIHNVWIVVTNEVNQGVDQSGVWRWTVDATVNWED